MDLNSIDFSRQILHEEEIALLNLLCANMLTKGNNPGGIYIQGWLVGRGLCLHSNVTKITMQLIMRLATDREEVMKEFLVREAPDGDTSFIMNDQFDRMLLGVSPSVDEFNVETLNPEDIL